jgi:hypothetical protein
MNQPFPTLLGSNRVGSRRFRRGLVLATYGGWVLVAMILKVISVSTSSSGFVAPALFCTTAVAWLVFIGRRTYINREVLASDTGLDERLVQNRNLAFRRAFQVFAMVVIVAWPISLMAIFWGPPPWTVQPSSQGFVNAFLIYFGALVLATTLPAAIWLWREPDPAEPETVPV